MRTVEEYKSWVLPLLLEDEAYNDLIEAMFDEIVELQKYNMGSYDGFGMNQAEEAIYFTDPEQWVICSFFKPQRAQYTLVQDGFTFDADSLVYTDVTLNRFAVYNYSFVLGVRYEIEVDVYDVIGSPIVHFGIGQLEQGTFQLSDGQDETLKMTILARDYWMYTGVPGLSQGTFKMRNIKVVGIESVQAEDERNLVLKRITAIDNAGREILERMRDGLTFPSIANTPEELLRQLIQDYNYFISTKGSELLSIMFFYFLGYAVEFRYLYARKGDYETRTFQYVQEKEDELLISSRPDEVLGEASMTQYNTMVLNLKPGHQIVVGDKIGNQDNPWPQVLVEVLRVDEDKVYLAEAVTVNYDSGTEEGDLIDIFRVYQYSVNPDPVNYFKTSHVDVFFKQQYLQGVDINFLALREFFERYLPINVVIRFFGFKTDDSEESFQITEPIFSIGQVDEDEFEIKETQTQFPVDAFIYLVGNETPVTMKDVDRTDVDGYSYLLDDDGNYLVID